MSVPVGMLREGSGDPHKQAYQLRVHEIYAELLGLPLDLPNDDFDVSGFEEALAYADRFEEPEVQSQFLQRCFAATFDDVRRSASPLSLPLERLLAESGGSVQRYVSWPKAARLEALEESGRRETARGVWTTPHIVDWESEEVFIGDTTLSLLVLRLQRRGVPLPQPADIISSLALQRPPARPKLQCSRTLEVYVDLKSPYAFLAIEPTYALPEDFNVDLVWKPYVLNIAGFLGSAEVGAKDNKVKEGTDRRSPAQWRAVKYAYSNVRRYAAERNPLLTVYGTRKIWDTTLAGTAMLFATDAGRLRQFQQRIWPAFWRRELDAENMSEVARALSESGIEASGFREFSSGAGLERLSKIQEEASRRGVFGVPSYFLDGELFFGREHLPILRRKLLESGCAKHDRSHMQESPYLWTQNEFFAGF